MNLESSGCCSVSSDDETQNESTKEQITAIKSEWDAIESYLYMEEDPNILKLTPNLLQECRFWRQKFPYLRIRGRAIINPDFERKNTLRNEIIDTVVDQVVHKITRGLVIGDKIGQENKEGVEEVIVQRPQAASRESYFERGKKKIEKGHKATSVASSSTINFSDRTSSTGALKPAPKGILKTPTLQRRQEKNSKYRKPGQNTPLYKETNALPRIASKNYWLDGGTPKRFFRANASSQRKKHFHLPPLKPNVWDSP